MTATLSVSMPKPGATATCRSCGSGLSHRVLDLGMSPRGAESLCADQLSQMEQFYPLQLWVCDQCFLVQVLQVGDGERIISECGCFASSSPSWLDHARRYVDRAVEELRLTPANRVIEVGSNDGYLLQYFVERGIPVLGVDAATNVAHAASARGVPTRIGVFDRRIASTLRDEGLTGDLLVVNNMLTDVHDLGDFLGALKLVLAPRGVVTMEFPYLARLIEDNQFDTIHHERLSYFSLFSVNQALESNGLKIYDVDQIDTRGGSLRVFACHMEDPLRPVSHRVNTLMAREHDTGINTLEYYEQFADRVREAKRGLLKFLIGAKRAKKHVAAFGVPRIGNTLLTYCGIHSDFIDYIVDPDPKQHGRFLPGSHIPIQSEESFDQTRPDYVLIVRMPAQHEIVPQLEHVRTWGARWVLPLPRVQVVA